LEELQHELAGASADVRWVRVEGLHLTLKFLGRVKADDIGAIRDALSAAVGTRPALRLHTRGLGAFPSLKRPRVLWAGIHADGVRELAGCIDAALLPLGFAVEKRPFNAHVTLARVRSLRGWSHLEERIAAHLTDDFGHCDAGAVVCYRSTLRRDGAVYEPLWTIPLCRNREGAHHG
jgi:2'-5' RNA ligase